MMITKIVLTGGPCAGKTTALSLIKKEFEKKGYRVLIIAETATELMKGGLTPFNCGTNLDFQKCQVGLQMFKERIFEQGALSMRIDKILIVCDRGVLDNKAFMTEEEFNICLEANHSNEKDEIKKYDAVFLLETAAKGALGAYTLSNNKTRTQSPDEAIFINERNIDAWSHHPYFRIIDNKGGFNSKLSRLLDEITSFLTMREHSIKE